MDVGWLTVSKGLLTFDTVQTLSSSLLSFKKTFTCFVVRKRVKIKEVS